MNLSEDKQACLPIGRFMANKIIKDKIPAIAVIQNYIHGEL